MPGPYDYTQKNGTLDIQFEGEHVVLAPGDTRSFDSPCTTIRFVNAVNGAGQTVNDKTPEGLEALQQLCTSQGGGPAGASPPPDPPPTPPATSDPVATDGGAPSDGQAETPATLGAPDATPNADTTSTARAPGESDGRGLAQQYYDGTDPMSEEDVADQLRDAGTAPEDFDAAMDWILHNMAPDGQAHPYFGQDNAPVQVRAQDPVEIFSGRFVLSVTDVAIPTRGLPLELTRHYASGPVSFGPLGYGWDHSYNVYLRELTGGGVAIWTGRLSEDVYRPAAAGGFDSPVGGRELLRFEPAAGLDPDRYVLTGLDGSRRIFLRPAGYPLPDRMPLVRVEDRHANAQSLAYDTEGRLQSATDDAGRSILLEYGDCGLLERIRDHTGRTWTYWHADDVEHLVCVTSPATSEFPEGVTTTYDYDDQAAGHPALRHNLTRVTDPDGRTVVENKYGDEPGTDDFGRVVTQVAGGYETTFAATRLQFVPRTPDAINVPALRVEVDDPGTLYVYTFNYRGDLLDQRLRLVADQSYRLVAQTFRYDPAGNVTERYEPNGFGSLLSYEDQAVDARARGNLLRIELVAPPTFAVPSRVVHRYTYDPVLHRMRTHTDADGHTTTFVYDVDELVGGVGEVIRIEYPDATVPGGGTQPRHEHFEYNTHGQLVRFESGAGATTTYDYAGAGPDEGYLSTLTEDAGGLVPVPHHFECNAWGQPSAFVDGLGNRTEHDLDELGRLREVRRPVIGGDDAQTAYRYHPSGRLRREEVPRGEYDDAVIADAFIAHEYTYDDFGTLSRATYGVNTEAPRRYEYTRDPQGNVTEIRDPLGRRTVVGYDERNLAISQTVAFGLPEEATWRYRYDPNGNRTALIDPAGHRVDYDYDAWDRLRTMTLPGSPDGERTRIRFGHDDLDQQTSLRIDGLTGPGVVGTLMQSLTTRDERSRVTRRTLGARTTRYAYDQEDRVVAQTDQRGATMQFEYDGRGRIARAVDPLGNEQRARFDAAGNEVFHKAIELEASGAVRTFATTTAYDGRGRPTTVTDPLGRTQSVTYDARDLLVGETDALGRGTRRRYGLAGELLAVSRDLDGVGPVEHSFGYDLAGRPVSYRDPMGAITKYTFDARDRRVAIRYPTGAEHTFAFDARLQAAAEITPGGTRRGYTYRPDGALSRIDFAPGPGVAATPPIELFADGLRRNVELTQGGVTVQRAYDELRLTTETGPWGTAGYSYDDLTGVAELRYPDGRQDAVSVDLLGRVRLISLATVGTAALTGPLAAGDDLVGYRYDGPARVAERRFFNGLVSRCEYDGAARLTGVEYHDPAGPLQRLRHVLDAADRQRLTWAEHLPQRPTRFDYDSLDRLVGVATGVAAADPGTGLSQAQADAVIATAAGLVPAELTTYHVNAADARTGELHHTAAGDVGTTYAFDAEYALLSSTTGTPPVVTARTHDADGRLTNDGSYAYAYDALGCLVEARELASGTVVLAQEYDALGRVIRRTDGTGTTRFAFLGRHAVEEQEDAGTPRRQLTFGPGADELVLVSDGTPLVPMMDQVQSVLGVADAGGAIRERYSFDAFGSGSIHDPAGTGILASSAVGMPLIFAGHPLLSLGLYDARARVYDPGTGRFLQPDPFDYADSADRYGYTHHDPVNWIDPDGDIALLVGLAVAAGVGLLVGAGSNAVRQTIQIHEGSRDDFSWSELAWSGGTGAVLGPALLVAPELAIPLAGMGVASAADQYSQGHWETGTFDLVLALAPFGSKNVRSATFGKGSVFSPARGLGPIDPLNTRIGRIGTMGQEFRNPTSKVTRATHVTTKDSLAAIKASNSIRPSAGQTGIKGAIDGSRPGTWVTPWRASALRLWSRTMTGLPERGAYVEFDVQPGELTRPGALKSLFGRYQRQIPGAVDLTGRNPVFGQLSGNPPSPMLADLVPFMHLTLPGDPFGWSQAPGGTSGAATPQKQK